jgi:DNA-binding beta-propeller fold protein YncE
MSTARLLSAAVISVLAGAAIAQVTSAPSPAGPYKIVNTIKVGGAGGYDYVFADADGRKLYIPRGDRVDVFDLDTLKPAGAVAPANGVHGATVDPKSKHGFSSSSPVVMWDTETLKTIKTIDVQGRPDGILFDPATQRVLVLSHSAPNATVLDAKDGSIVGTIDLGGAPEQGVSDGQGHLYIDVEDKGTIAVVDAKTLKVTTHYDLGGKSGGLAGLAMDVKNRILFACGRTPATCAVVNADDGTIIATLPIGTGVDAAGFNPNTMEAFVSTRDGKLTIIKETDPKTFAVEQTLQTMDGAKTSTLDTKTNQVFLIASDRTATAATPAPTPATAPAAGRGGRGGQGGVFTIIVAGKADAK